MVSRELFGYGAERRRVSAGDNAGEQVDLGVEFHPPQLFDIGVGAGSLVRGDRLDLALAEEPPWALISSAAIMWPLSDGSPSTAVALVRKVMRPTLNGVSGSALRGFLGRLEDPGAANHTGAGDPRPADGHAQCVEKPATTCG
jgi:hypothetical protein